MPTGSAGTPDARSISVRKSGRAASALAQACQINVPGSTDLAGCVLVDIEGKRLRCLQLM
jgi:hypothetical protein